MGKFVASLLSIVFQLYVLSSILADDQVRQVQEALRKRHLYYGNPTGEMSPALSAAIAHYQEKKGFPRTGSIDAETSASLGITRPVPQATEAPVVVVDNGAVRGANGEPLPDALLWPPEQYRVRFGLASVDSENVGPILAATNTELKPVPIGRPKAAGPRQRLRARPQKETNPFVLAYRSVDHFLFGDKDQKKKRGSAKRL
jgi:peptidoglycan hydrolase-like protein with peptidoglycan-binding domain